MRWIYSGYANEIAVVNGEVAFRFPKNLNAKRSLRMETMVLERLKNKTSIQLPVVIEVRDDYSYRIDTYISGKIYSDLALRKAINGNEKKLAHPIAQFIKEINSVLSADEVRFIREQAQIDTDKYDNYHENTYRKIDGYASNENSSINDLYLKFRQELNNYLPDGLDSGEVIIHDDLHAGNLVFDDEVNLVGIIDFGDITTGNIYRELRPLYRYGDKLTKLLIKLLGDKFGPIDFNTVRTFSILNELAVLIEQKESPKRPEERIEFIKRILAEWLGKNWGEV